MTRTSGRRLGGERRHYSCREVRVTSEGAVSPPVPEGPSFGGIAGARVSAGI